MNVESLLNKQTAVESSFNDLKKRKDELTLDLERVDAEIFRTQGEYRVYTQLLSEVQQSDPATTINVEESTKGKLKDGSK